jgi:hypothetical protein
VLSNDFCPHCSTRMRSMRRRGSAAPHKS